MGAAQARQLLGLELARVKGNPSFNTATQVVAWRGGRKAYDHVLEWQPAFVTVPFSGAFRGRRVMVTGHTGFKGSWLTLWLHTLGARIVGYSLAPPTTPSNFEASGVAEL